MYPRERASGTWGTAKHQVRTFAKPQRRSGGEGGDTSWKFFGPLTGDVIRHQDPCNESRHDAREKYKIHVAITKVDQFPIERP